MVEEDSESTEQLQNFMKLKGSLIGLETYKYVPPTTISDFKYESSQGSMRI